MGARSGRQTSPQRKRQSTFKLRLIQAGLLQGKSIGFLRLKSHAPTSDEVRKAPALADCRRIIDEWLLIEYACTFLPMNQQALVEAVSKSGLPPARLKQWGVAIPEPPPDPTQPPPLVVPFTPETELHRAIERQIAAFDFAGLARRAIAEGVDRARGRV